MVGYKLKNTKTGFYSAGGYNWTAKGKVWNSRGALTSHIKWVLRKERSEASWNARNQYQLAHPQATWAELNAVSDTTELGFTYPEEWQVIVVELVETKSMSVEEFREEIANSRRSGGRQRTV